MVSDFQQYEQGNQRAGRRERRFRATVYLLLLLGLTAFWFGVLMAFTGWPV